MISSIVQAAVLAALAVESPPPDGISPPDPLASAPVADEEPETGWTGNVAAGVFQSFGNSERFSGNATADFTLRRPNDRFILSGWAYLAREQFVDPSTGVADDVTTDRRYGGLFEYNHFLGEKKKSYVLANVLAETDLAADLSLRSTVGAGYGRQFVDKEKMRFKADAGLNYFVLDYKSGDDQDYPAIRLAWAFEYDFAKAWSLTQSSWLYPPLEGGANFYSKYDTRVRYDVSSNFFLQFQWLLDYNTEPAPGAKNADNRLFLSIGYTI